MFFFFVKIENCYASIVPPTACSTSNHSYNQSANCKHQQQYSINSNVAQPMNGIHAPCNAIYANPQLCSSQNHCTANGSKCIESNNYSAPHTSIPHSKSLEHYHEPSSKAAYHHQHLHPARHSFDKSTTNAYDFNGYSYDCLDGASVGQLNERYALPMHMDSHYAQIAPSGNVYDQMTASSYNHTYATPYTQSRNNCNCSNNNDHRINTNVRLATNECHSYHPLPSSQCEIHGKMYSKSNNVTCGHGTFEPYLINFDEKPINGDRHITNDPNDYRRYHENVHVKSHYNQYEANDKERNAFSLKYSLRDRHTVDYDNYTQQDYLPHIEPKRSATLKNYARNKQLLGEYEEHFDANDSRNSRQSDFDSFDSGNNLSMEKELSGHVPVEQMTSNKIQDGVGSYETWNYVFRNIGKNGYNKVNNCDADDLTVQGLDLDAVPLPNEKRRSRNLDANESILMSKQSNGTGGTNRKTGVDSIATANTTTTNTINNGSSINRKTVSVEMNRMPKSMLKQTAPPPYSFHSNGVRENGRDQHETNDIVKKNNFKLTNGNNISVMPNGDIDGSRGGGGNHSTASSSIRNDKQQQVDEIRSASNEWSCKFCTFLNPVKLRVCQMCFKSQDFVIDAPKASTCV